MQRAAVVTLVFAVLASLATFFIASGDACPGVPSMTWEDACLKSRDKQEPRWYQLCQDTLRTGLNTAQVTFFALMATRKASLRYESYPRSAGSARMLQTTSAMAKPPLEHCKQRYGAARGLVDKIMEQLPRCRRQAGVLRRALLAVQGCRSDLWSGYRSSPSPLYAAVLADLDLTVVALIVNPE
uniref:Pectinesterase inhibitor domain-containing protein n=1 Tax=Setaria italica TaxID=4555 RepID=K3YLH0_SETIT